MVLVSKMVSLLLLLHSFLVLSVGAGRTGTADLATGLVVDEKGGADSVSELFADEENSICGGSRIRKLLTEIPSDASFRCSQWPMIEADADSYLKDVAVKLDGLNREVERLNKALEDAKKADKQPWDIEGSAKPLLQKIVEDAFSTPESPDKDAAIKALKCGAATYAERKPHKVPVGSYRKAKKAIDQELKEVFQAGNTRIQDKANVALVNMCAELTGLAEDPVWVETKKAEGTYCDELCSYFTSTAMLQSGETAGAYAGPEKATLEKQLREADANLKYNLREQEECVAAKAALQKFSEELVQLNEMIDEKHEGRMDAQDNLDEATEALNELKTERTGLDQALEKATETLGISTQNVQKLSEAMAKAVAQKALTQAAVDKAKGALGEASTELAKAMAASIALDGIKGLVQETLVRMWTYFNTMIVEPVKKMGLRNTEYVEQYFQDSLADIPTQEDLVETKQNVEDTLTDMDGICEGLGEVDANSKPTHAFGKVQNQVDFTILCSYGANAQEVVKQVHELVKSRAQAAQDVLKAIARVAEPYADVEDATETGEPAGLRKIETVFKDISYYSGYLAHWKADAEPPKFLELLASLKATVESLTEQENKMKQAVAEVEDTMAKQIEAMKGVATELQQAIDQKAIDDSKAQEAQRMLEEQNEAIQDEEANLDHLRELLRLAEEAYQKAKTDLAETHMKGTRMK